QVCTAGCPAHRLTFVEALVHDLVDRRLYEAGGDPFAGVEPLAIVHDVAGVVGDIRRKLAERGGELPQRRRGGIVFQFGSDIVDQTLIRSSAAALASAVSASVRTLLIICPSTVSR